jgi:hypothetical protein
MELFKEKLATMQAGFKTGKVLLTVLKRAADGRFVDLFKSVRDEIDALLNDTTDNIVKAQAIKDSWDSPKDQGFPECDEVGSIAQLHLREQQFRLASSRSSNWPRRSALVPGNDHE